MSPPVSVLMPVYNGEQFLAEAIDSVLNQTFSDFEFVIVDDGSTDSTPAILGRYSDPRIKVVTITHSGLIPALNECVRHASGRYFARMDADDISRPERFSRQVELLDSNSEFGLVTCWSDQMTEEGSAVGECRGGIESDMILRLAESNDIVHGSVMMRASMLPDPPYGSAPEDYRLWIDLARRGIRFGCVSENLYGFRTHSDRYSLVKAESQSRAIVDVQWPLLEECSQTRDLGDDEVCARLVRGWGTVGGAAFRSGQDRKGLTAYREFRRFAGKTKNHDAVFTGAEALVWGGCPLGKRLALRLLEIRYRPTTWRSYHKAIVALPGMELLRRAIGRR